MDLLEKSELDNQMTVLQSAEDEEVQSANDEVEDLSNSLRAIVQEEIVKPKLQCLMMDPAFSMVTLQSEDSGIFWETASSRCSTPWASEIGSPAPDLHASLVPRSPASPGSESAGRIIFIMDEEQMIRQKKRKRNKVPEKLPALRDEVPGEPDRPAMVEVSVPNVMVETEKDEDAPDSNEAGNQRLFRLVSEGSEILNIVVPPKVTTVDEEETKVLEDNLSYLEATPVIKAGGIPEEPEASEEMESLNVQTLPEPLALPPAIKPAPKQGTCEDYFDYLDHQTPTGASTEDANRELEAAEEQELYLEEDASSEAKSAPDVSEDSASVSNPETTSEHVDEVFYGGGRDPDFPNTSKGAKEGEHPKSPLKKSGCALFGSQESILTPIYLPEGPQKIIDLVLLEEPKAMAFMYTDLYADALGSRTKQDDTESVTSEKSFHSQQSDLEDRGYLEKFVLKDETPLTPVDPLHDGRKEDVVRMWSQAAFSVKPKDKPDTETAGDEITDFFRSSASSSPCEPVPICQEPEEPKREAETRRVVFQDEGQQRASEEDRDIAQAFAPLDIGWNAPEEDVKASDYKSVINEYAAKTCSSAPSKSEKNKVSSIAKPPKHAFIDIDVPQTVKPITPRYKPFLELTPLLPVQVPEEDGQKEDDPTKGEGSDEACSSADKAASVDSQDCNQITEQEGKESVPIPPQESSATGQEETGSKNFSVVN